MSEAEELIQAQTEKILQLRAELEACYSAIQVANDRQEQAEETLRVTDDSLFRAVEDAQKAEAAIARVRRLALDYNSNPVRAVPTYEIMDALDGAE